MTKVTKAVVLVSLGRHPASGRARRAIADSRAVELGLRLFGPQLGLVHAGSASEAGLREYLGMGAHEMTVLDLDRDRDVARPLAQWLRSEAPDLILMGDKTESDDGTGMLPYVLAHALGAALIVDVIGFEIEGDTLTAVQAMPDAGRRTLAVESPVIAVISRSAGAARQVSNRARIAGALKAVKVEADLRVLPPGFVERPARHRPRRLKSAGADLGARLAALAGGAAAGKGNVVQGVPVEQAARALLAFLRGEGVVRAPAQDQSASSS